MLGRHVHELVQVLDAALGVNGMATPYGDLGLEHVPVASPFQKDLDQPARLGREQLSGPELFEQVEEPPDPGQRLA